MCEIQGGGTGCGSWMASILLGVLLVARHEFRDPPFAGGLFGRLKSRDAFGEDVRFQRSLALLPCADVWESVTEDRSIVDVVAGSQFLCQGHVLSVEEWAGLGVGAFSSGAAVELVASD